MKSIHSLQNSKYGNGNKTRLASIQSALKQASPLFAQEQNHEKPALISFRNIDQTDQIPKILEEFVSDFESQCLQRNGSSAKNYSLFAVTLLKIIKTLDADKKRGLLSAHAINILNKMFANHPVKYPKRAIRDPVSLVFVIIELAIDAERNLSKPYEFDVSIPHQIGPLMQQYHMKYDNALLQIISEFEKMPKFRLTVSIGERHKEIVKVFLRDGISHISLENKIIRVKNLIEKIIHEKNDSMVLEHYNMLRLCYNDKELIPHLVEIAKKQNKTEKRFTNTILDEISNL